MDIDLSEITVILGQKPSGKSVLFEHLLAQTDRFMCIDPKAEHGPPGAVYPESPRDAIMKWSEGKTKQVIREVRFDEETLNQYLRAFGQFQEAYLYIDESHNWMSANYIPESLKHLVKWHISHSNCGLVCAAHKAKEINDQVFTQTDNYFIFAYGDHEDSKFSRASIPDKHRVTSLDPNSYQFLYYKDVAGAQSEIRGPVPIPEHLK